MSGILEAIQAQHLIAIVRLENYDQAHSVRGEHGALASNKQYEKNSEK